MIEKNTKNISIEEEIEKVKIKYTASKIVFMASAFLFFLSFFFIWAWYYREQLLQVFPSLYLAILLTLNIYIFYFFRLKYLNKKFISYIMLVISIVISIAISIPLIFDINSLIK